MVAGKRSLAINSYEKSLKLDPQNLNAVAQLEALYRCGEDVPESKMTSACRRLARAEQSAHLRNER